MLGDKSQDFLSGIAFLRVRVTTPLVEVKTELACVFRKAQVAPRKVLTVQKLVLQAALATRLKNELFRALFVTFNQVFM